MPATIGRVSVDTNMHPSPNHLATRIPWSGASRRTSARNAASTSTASSSPSVSFMRVKPHMSTNAKHRWTRMREQFGKWQRTSGDCGADRTPGDQSPAPGCRPRRRCRAARHRGAGARRSRRTSSAVASASRSSSRPTPSASSPSTRSMMPAISSWSRLSRSTSGRGLGRRCRRAAPRTGRLRPRRTRRAPRTRRGGRRAPSASELASPPALRTPSRTRCAHRATDHVAAGLGRRRAGRCARERDPTSRLPPITRRRSCRLDGTIATPAARPGVNVAVPEPTRRQPRPPREHVGGGATARLQRLVPVVGSVDPVERHLALDATRRFREVGLARHRVARPAREQHRHREPGEVVGPRLLGTSGRVQRIAEEQEPEGRHRVVVGTDDERAVPTAHRAAAEDELLGSELRSRRASSAAASRVARVEHLRAVGRLLARRTGRGS